MDNLYSDSHIIIFYVCVCIYIYIYTDCQLLYTPYVNETCSSTKMTETLYNKINIVQLVGSEICVYCSVKYARMLW
jgi:hypothetical protein